MCFRHMSRTTNARTAGFTFLFYIAVGVASMVLSGQATGAAGTAKLAGIAQHALQIRLTVVLGLLSMMSALMLGVTLYSLTRDQDPELALLALTCRVAEGVLGAALPQYGWWRSTCPGRYGSERAGRLPV
jgi:Na+-driven multidrug efflux pump